MQSVETNGQKKIFHVSSRENIMSLRDEILRRNGFQVSSSVYSSQVLTAVAYSDYDLVLIDVEADVKVQSAQELCDNIKKVQPGQHVAFVCNYSVSIESDCPDEIIRTEFNPEALVQGVKQLMDKID
jgi:DNA-binding NtrC family response regulator